MTAKAKDGASYHPWTTYIWAREEARRCGDRRVGTDHLVLGLLHDPAISSVLGVTLEHARGALDHLDRQALGAVGMAASLQAPPIATRQIPARPTLKSVLHERLPLTPAARLALQQAGKPMRRGRQVTAEAVLRQLLDQQHPDPATVLFEALNVDIASIRNQLDGTG